MPHPAERELAHGPGGRGKGGGQYPIAEVCQLLGRDMDSLVSGLDIPVHVTQTLYDPAQSWGAEVGVPKGRVEGTQAPAVGANGGGCQPLLP